MCAGAIEAHSESVVVWFVRMKLDQMVVFVEIDVRIRHLNFEFPQNDKNSNIIMIDIDCCKFTFYTFSLRVT